MIKLSLTHLFVQSSWMINLLMELLLFWIIFNQNSFESGQNHMLKWLTNIIPSSCLENPKKTRSISEGILFVLTIQSQGRPT